jgi:hypothetical protein
MFEHGGQKVLIDSAWMGLWASIVLGKVKKGVWLEVEKVTD